MAEGKKSFILYTELLNTVKKLPMEKRGELFTVILEYVNDLNPDTSNDLLLDVAFEPIKNRLKSDLKKYESRAERSRENGSKGGRPPKDEKPKKPSGLNENPKEPEKPDTVTDTVTDTVNESTKVDNNASRFFEDNELNDVFNRWLKMLDERKKPMTQSSIEALCMRLNRQSVEHSIKQITQSLEKGWLNLRAIEETESKLSKEEEEEIDIAILKHQRNVLSGKYDNQPTEDNRLRRLP